MKKDTSSPAYRTYVMVLLVVVYTFNFVDRQIVGILAVPIKADLGLNDTELGLMGDCSADILRRTSIGGSLSSLLVSPVFS